MDIVLKLKLDDKEYDAKIVDADKQLAGLRKQTESVGDAMSKWGQIVTGFNQALELSQRVFSQLKDFVMSGAELQVLRDNFGGTAENIELFRKATAQTVSEANLIKLSNQATDLGISLHDQAILFSLAEDASDKYGGGVEANFQNIINASEGMGKGLRSLGIQTAVYNNILDRLAKAQGDKIENLDAETQKEIRLKAIIEASGKTIEDATNKKQENIDKLEALGVSVDEAREKMGLWLSEQLIPLVDLLGQSEKGTFGLRDAIVALTGSIPDLLLVSSSLKFLSGASLRTMGKAGGYGALAGLLAFPLIDAANNRGNTKNSLAGGLIDNLLFGNEEIGVSKDRSLQTKAQIQSRIAEINKEIKNYDKGTLQWGTLSQERNNLFNLFNNLIAGGDPETGGSGGNKTNTQLLKEQDEFQKKLMKMEEDYVAWLESITAGGTLTTSLSTTASVKGFRGNDAGARYNVGGKSSASTKGGGTVVRDVEKLYDELDGATQIFIDGMMGMSDTFWADFLMTGRQAKNGWDALWLGFQRSALQKLAGIANNELFGILLKLVGLALAPITGGASTAVAGVASAALAEGGIITKPTFALAGESGPEAFIPLSKFGNFNNSISLENKLDSVVRAFEAKQFEIDNNMWRTVNKRLDVIERQKSVRS